MAVSAQAQPASGQTIEAYVGVQLDNARMGPIHWRVLALVAGGYFFDVIDFTIFGALVPDIIKSGFATAYQVSWIGFATLIGLGIGTLGQGEFTDRFGRKAVYQFGLLLTIYFRDSIGWRGIWIIIGIGALVIFVLRFSLPESPRWLATHGQGRRALDLLQRMGLRTVPIETLRTDAASDTKSDPIGIVFRNYPRRVIAGMICFYA